MLKDSILKTIAFFDIFEFPLTAEEVKEYLYNYPPERTGPVRAGKKSVHIKEIEGTLDEMENIEKIHDYYVLQGREKLIEIRKSRKFIAEKYWARVRQYGQYITQVPFVEMTAVCNNLAYDNATESSDIDLFIVIKEGRMWIARLIITLILQFFGVRRYGKKIAGRFCLSFFITPKKLNMEPLLLGSEDPYMAYWTKLLKPIYGAKVYQKFIDENKDWLYKKYGLKLDESKGEQIAFHGKASSKKFWEFILKGWFGNLIEWLLKKTFKQKTLHRSKKLGAGASVIVEDDILKFHNLDRRKEYFDKWKKAIV